MLNYVDENKVQKKRFASLGWGGHRNVCVKTQEDIKGVAWLDISVLINLKNYFIINSPAP